MSSKAKNTSESVLTAYFSEMSGVSVPTLEQERESFRKLISVEAETIALFLSDGGQEVSLRSCSLKEELKLPQKLFQKSGLRDDVVRFVRLTDSGRSWFQECMSSSLKSKDRRARSLNVKRERIKNAFIAANLRLTVSLAKKYAKFCHHQSLADLIQEGNLGLMRAVDRFDPDRGFRFATYAMWWIRHHVKRAMSDKEGVVRVPVHVSDLAQQLMRMDGGWMTETGSKMEPDQMAKTAKVSVGRVLSVLSSRQRVIHLDAPTGEDDNMSFLDTLMSEVPGPLDSICRSEAHDELLVLLSGLAPFESRIIRHRFGMDGPEQLTLQEVADRYDLSRERIRQVEEKALKKLRGRMAGRSLGEYLPESA
jgi:RNA polymerase sigma factor (sigma-70 family)